MKDKAGGRDPRLDRAGPQRRGLGPRRLVWGAFAASTLMHVLFVALYPSLFPLLEPGEAEYVFPVGGPPAPGIEVMRVVEVDVVEEVEPPEEPELELVEERDVRVAAQRAGTPPPVADFARPGISAAERLRPSVTDPRLWAPIPQRFRELTPQQREELALAGRLEAWYDSVAAAAAAESAMTDWTFTDGDGGRWGVADGMIYLGDYAIPAPIFAAPPGAARERMWQWDELARQRGQMAVQQTVEDRIEAIRARRDAERARERAAQQSDSTSPGG